MTNPPRNDITDRRWSRADKVNAWAAFAALVGVIVGVVIPGGLRIYHYVERQ